MVQLYMQMGQQPPAPRDLYSKMPQIFQGQGYDARKVEITQESPIPDDATTLMILSPKNLNDRQRYEIAKFLHRGGNVFMAVQNHEYDYNPGRRGGFDISARPITTGIDPLIEKEHILRTEKKIIIDGWISYLLLKEHQEGDDK